jgi:hypothetical protein
VGEDRLGLLQGGLEVRPKPVALVEAQEAGAKHGHRAGVEEATEGEEDADGELHVELEVGDGGVGLGGTAFGSQTTTVSFFVVNMCVYVFLPACGRETNVSLWWDGFFFTHKKKQEKRMAGKKNKK